MRNRKNLYLIGASHFGREVESWLERIPENNRDWDLKGYLHSFSGESPLEKFPSDYNVVGNWESFSFTSNDYCLITVADCSWKERIYNLLKNRVNFFTFISPDAVIGKFNIIGDGSIICPGCVLTTNVKLGKCITLNCGSQIGHDVKVGDFSSIMSQVEFGGFCKIGEKVFIGSHANLIPKIKIGDNSIIGAGSVVIRNVKEGITVFGNPAKKV